MQNIAAADSASNADRDAPIRAQSRPNWPITATRANSRTRSCQNSLNVPHRLARHFGEPGNGINRNKAYTRYRRSEILVLLHRTPWPGIYSRCGGERADSVDERWQRRARTHIVRVQMPTATTTRLQRASPDWSVFLRCDWCISIRIWRRIRCGNILRFSNNIV